MRIGVGERTFETFATEQDDETMAFARFNDDLGVADFFDLLGQQRTKFFAHRSVDATGTAIGDDAFFVEGAEIGARRDVACAKFQAEPERFDDAATDLKFERVVAKQPEVAGAAAGRDAGRDRNHAALGGIFGERVHVWSRCGFKRSEVVLVARSDVTEAVKDEKHEFGIRLQCQFGIESIKIHIRFQSQIVRITEWRKEPSREPDDVKSGASASTRFKSRPPHER
jgi:hypothetical protein